MSQLRIQSLLFINLLFLFSSCSIRNYGLSDVKNNSGVISSIPRSIFPSQTQSLLYKAQVDLYGRYFGGLLLVKWMPDSTYRLIMTTETGISLFDLELHTDTMIVHSCMEKLNKTPVLKTIENDFKLVLLMHTINQVPQLLEDAEKRHLVYKYTKGKKHIYYFIENKTGYLNRIEEASPWYKKISISLNSFERDIPVNMEFKHYNAKLQIKLRLLKHN